MDIIKSGGEKVPFDVKKVRRSILRTGASEKIANRVLRELKLVLYDGMSTQELYGLVRKLLKNRDVCYACRYSLREAILKFGPAGFKFEKYVASILNAHRWNTYIPQDELAGSCVNHEVDVIAEKDKRRIFIEAKFRNEYRGYVNLKDTMATWSRFLDLVDGAAVGKCEHLDEVWIVTNARFSRRAKKFGTCKGMHLIGWNFPSDYPFNQMVGHTSLYPVTVLDGLQRQELEMLSDQGLMLCKEVIDLEKEELMARTQLSETRAQEIIELCVSVVGEEQDN